MSDWLSNMANAPSSEPPLEHVGPSALNPKGPLPAMGQDKVIAAQGLAQRGAPAQVVQDYLTLSPDQFAQRNPRYIDVLLEVLKTFGRAPGRAAAAAGEGIRQAGQATEYNPTAKPPGWASPTPGAWEGTPGRPTSQLD